MELAWLYFRRLYEGLLDCGDEPDACRQYLSGRRTAAAEHLAELEPLRHRERLPAGGYTEDDEQPWRLMKLYGLSRVSDYLIERFCADSGNDAGRAGSMDDSGPAMHTEFFSAIGLLNWDGEADIGGDPPVLPAGWSEDEPEPLDQRRELLLHRCFVRGPLPADEGDRFPHGDRLSLVAAELPLPESAIVRVSSFTGGHNRAERGVWWA
ncbi:hypothetical protein [Amycolatopsis tolypomycina]|uniref:hypothetical protein n=1 Tax=Amycolatopsis tolypomycina TaxID=208445 RepID=UPI0033BD8D6E